MPRFAPEVEAAIKQASAQYGIPESRLRAYAAIESGGNPRNQTGSYLGLFQLSQDEFRKHGGQGNIFDPVANANAAAVKYRAEAQDFERQYGRPPTDGELYLIHQQGVGGSAAHWRNPDAPAWQNMASTGEGRQKGEGWARQAIWGNVPSDVRAKYGSVDNLTSRQFADLWNTKVQRFGGEGGGQLPAASSPAPSMSPNDLEPSPTPAAVPATPGGAAPAGGYGGNLDENAYLTAWAKQYDDSEDAKKTGEAKAQSARLSADKYVDEARGQAPGIKPATPPRVGIQQLLAAMKARGVDTVGMPGLGTDERKRLGTGRG